MQVTLEPKSCGSIIIRATNKRYRRILREYMREVYDEKAPSTAYLQRDYEILEWLNLSPRQRRALSSGWSVTIRRDAWELLHLWGYDAHTLAESGRIK